MQCSSWLPCYYYIICICSIYVFPHTHWCTVFNSLTVLIALDCRRIKWAQVNESYIIRLQDENLLLEFDIKDIVLHTYVCHFSKIEEWRSWLKTSDLRTYVVQMPNPLYECMIALNYSKDSRHTELLIKRGIDKNG